MRSQAAIMNGAFLFVLTMPCCARGSPCAAPGSKGLSHEPIFDGADAGRTQRPHRLVEVARRCGPVVGIESLRGHDQLLFLVDQTGRIRRYSLEDNRSSVLLTVDSNHGWEQGLLGLAFHPLFNENGRLFVNYTMHPEGQGLLTRIEEWHIDPAEVATGRAKAVRTLYEIGQPYSNHNAGRLVFGPDGMLYIGFGDGGSGGDPHGNGQNPATALGSIIRIDVDGVKPWSIPADNPFADGAGGALPEIWAIGVRNPWGMTFDSKERLIIADVGQHLWEEITFIEKGANHGWNTREGRHCFPPDAACTSEGFIEPIYEYGRQEGISVTGGVMSTMPGALKDHFIFGDYGSGRIWALDPPADSSVLVSAIALGRFKTAISAFGRDQRGQVYVADWTRQAIYRLDPVIGE